MNWEVAEVVIGEKPLSLIVKFKDGTNGKVIFKEKSLFGVFEPLKDPNFFSKVFIENGTVCWPGEVDLAPDAMHTQIKKNGQWIID